MKGMTADALADRLRLARYLILGILVAALLIGFLVNRGAPKSEAPVGSSGLTTVSQSELEAQYGLRASLIAVTAAGGLVDVRLKVTDAEKAKLLLKDAASYPELVVSGSNAILTAPEESRTPKPVLENGQMIMLLFPNARNAVAPGAKVAVLFGNIRLEPTAVQ